MVARELLDVYYSILGCCLVHVESLKIHFYVVARLFLVVARKLLQ